MAFRPSNFKCLRYLTVNFNNGDMHMYYYTAYENESDNDKAALITALQKIGYRIEKDDEATGELIAVNDKVRANEVQAVELVTKENHPVKKARSTHSDNYVSPTARFAKAIFGYDENFKPEEFFNPDVSPVLTSKKDGLNVSGFLRYENLPENLQGKIPDRRTRTVHDAMNTLILAGNKWLTLQHIAFVMNGYTHKRITDDFLNQIKQEVELLIHTWCTIDATKEAKEEGKKRSSGYDFQEVKLNSPLIPSRELEVVDMNGQRVSAYEILAEPILYSYAKQKKEIITVPIDIIALPEKINMTFENIILRNYLIEQIEIMKSNHRSCIMKYETIFKVLDKQEATRDDKKRIRQRIKIFLDNWVDLAYIKGYKEESKGRLIYSVRIELYEHEPKKLK